MDLKSSIGKPLSSAYGKRPLLAEISIAYAVPCRFIAAELPRYETSRCILYNHGQWGWQNRITSSSSTGKANG